MNSRLRNRRLLTVAEYARATGMDDRSGVDSSQAPRLDTQGRVGTSLERWKAHEQARRDVMERAPAWWASVKGER